MARQALSKIDGVLRVVAEDTAGEKLEKKQIA
jgi:hypothetical protein